MTHKRKLEKALLTAGFSYKGSNIEGSEYWKTPDGEKTILIETREVER